MVPVGAERLGDDGLEAGADRVGDGDGFGGHIARGGHVARGEGVGRGGGRERQAGGGDQGTLHGASSG